MSQSWRIRLAEKKDCPEILRLITELATFTNLAHHVHMTKEILEQDGFGDTKYFYCIVAELEDSSGQGQRGLLGMTLFHYKYSSWEGKSVHMEDLYVTPEWRGKGIGTRLWKSVAKFALDNGCKRLEWVALDWNKPAVELYKKQGAEEMIAKEGWLFFRMSTDVLQNFTKDLPM